MVVLLRVMIVEDEAWVREGVASALAASPEVSVAGTCEGPASALRLLRGGAAIDVALVDLGLGARRLAGAELIAAIRRLWPSVVCLAFTVHEDAAAVFTALRCGARGYLLKSTPIDRLGSAVAEAAAGGSPMSPSVARLVVDAFADSAAEVDASRALTPKEREVLVLLARGHTYADVARALGVSVGTTQTHVKSIYCKLEIASKAEAAAFAARAGLV